MRLRSNFARIFYNYRKCLRLNIADIDNRRPRNFHSMLVHHNRLVNWMCSLSFFERFIFRNLRARIQYKFEFDYSKQEDHWECGPNNGETSTTSSRPERSVCSAATSRWPQLGREASCFWARFVFYKMAEVDSIARDCDESFLRFGQLSEWKRTSGGFSWQLRIRRRKFGVPRYCSERGRRKSSLLCENKRCWRSSKNKKYRLLWK